jgi:sec-independent protein translocase protein TatB
MFDIGFSELIVIAVLALLVLGPKRLPEAARLAGRALGRVRHFLTEARRDFDRELNTAEMDELRVLKNELSETKRMLHESTQRLYDDIAHERADVESAIAGANPASAEEKPPVAAPAKPASKRKPRRTKKNGDNGRTAKR